jgi:hypothetical protein
MQTNLSHLSLPKYGCLGKIFFELKFCGINYMAVLSSYFTFYLEVKCWF